MAASQLRVPAPLLSRICRVRRNLTFVRGYGFFSTPHVSLPSHHSASHHDAIAGNPTVVTRTRYESISCLTPNEPCSECYSGLNQSRTLRTDATRNGSIADTAVDPEESGGAASFPDKRRRRKQRAGKSANNSVLPPVGGSDAGDSSFVKPLSVVYPRVPCRLCQDAGTVPCSACSGSGFLPAGGFHRRNPVDLGRIVGSKWTARQRTLGWRHFRVTAKRRAAAEAPEAAGTAAGAEGASDGAPAPADGAAAGAEAAAEGHGAAAAAAAPAAATGRQGGGRAAASGAAAWFVRLEATCDSSASLWLNAAILKDRSAWAAGWLQKEQLQRLEEQQAGAGGLGGSDGSDGERQSRGAAVLGRPQCKACEGRGLVACRVCAKRKGGGGGQAGAAGDAGGEADAEADIIAV